jgi:hypothetical protein
MLAVWRVVERGKREQAVKSKWAGVQRLSARRSRELPTRARGAGGGCRGRCGRASPAHVAEGAVVDVLARLRQHNRRCV